MYPPLKITEYLAGPRKSRSLSHRLGPAPGRGGTAETEPASPAPRPAPPNHVTPELIRQDWTLNADGLYIFGTASLDRLLASSNQCTLDNPGRGNCAWYALQGNGSHPATARFASYQELKAYILDFATRNRHHLLHSIAAELAIPDAQREAWIQQLLIALTTNGSDADFDQLRVAAMALHTPILIRDVGTHSSQLIAASCPWDSHPPTTLPIPIAYRLHNKFWAYDQQFTPIAPLQGHYWAIIATQPLRRSARHPRPITLNDFVMHTPLRRPRARGSSSLGAASPADPDLTFMADPASANGSDASQSSPLLPAVDHDLALTILRRADLPPYCVNWPAAYPFLLTLTVDRLLKHQITTFRYIPGDARPLFRKAYCASLTLLSQLPPEDASPTTAFLHQQVLALINMLPALLVSQVPALGTIACIDLIKGNCQKFLAGKWSALLYAAVKSADIPHQRTRVLPPRDVDQQEIKFKKARQQIQAGSLSSAYKILTGPGLYPADPLNHFRNIHRDADLTQLHTHPDLCQQIAHSSNWDDIIPLGTLNTLITRMKNGKAADRWGMRNEFLKVLVQDFTVLNLFRHQIVIPMLTGQTTFDCSALSSCTGALVIGLLKPNGLPRPVQIPDRFRAIGAGVVCNYVFKSKAATEYFETGNQGQRADIRFTQRGLSKDGCSYVAKELQRYLENADALTPTAIDADLPIVVKVDIVEFFPSADRQVLFDMCAGVASRDYPHTSIKKGDCMPTHPIFQTLLPIITRLYSKPQLLHSYHRDRDLQFVPFKTGVSQGCQTGSGCSALELHMAVHAALSAFPTLDVRVFGIFDDLHFTGTAHAVGPILSRFVDILRDCLQLSVNLSKSAVLVLQAHSAPPPLLSLDLAVPDLANLPLHTEGFVSVGVPIGHLSYLDKFMATLLADLNTEFQQLLQHPYPHDFLLLFKYCCNQKLMYLLRIIGPHIRLYSQQFDHMMDMLFGQYFNINLSAPAQLDSIPLNSNALTHQHAMQLARIQLRSLPSDGGMNYLAMLDATTSAYTAAHVRHMQKLVTEAVSGPYILPPSASTCLFSDPFRNTYADLTARGAPFLRTDVDLPYQPQGQMYLPDLALFEAVDTATALLPAPKLCTAATRQKTLTSWYREHSPQRPLLQRLRNAYPSLNMRLTLLAPQELQAPHKPLDIPAKLVLKYQPNAFLHTFSRVEEGLSKHQMALYQCLLLGLPICTEDNPDLMCSCGQPRDWYGYHRLNCKRHAGHAFRSAHDVIQNQLARELRRLSLRIRDNDTDMRRRHSHLTTQKRGDIAVIGTPTSPTVYDPVSRLYRSDIIIDVKLVSMVSGLDTVLNPSALIQNEASKVNKHGPFYAPLGFSFLPFAASCFGGLGPAAIRYLYALADYELAQHDDWLAQQGLDPLMDPSARAQYRHHCFRQSSARLGHAIAKATVMRLLACPSLPLPPLPSRDLLARNRPGPADPVFSFPSHFSPASLIASCSHPPSPAASVSAHPSPHPSLS